MAISLGFTLVFHDPEKGTQTTFHMRPSPEEVSMQERHLHTLVPLPGLNVVYEESHGRDIIPVSWRGTFGLKQRPANHSPTPKIARERDPSTITGTDLFFDFKRLFWGRYLDLKESKDPRISKGTKIEYHDWDSDLHYWATPVRFGTPRGKDNRTFFRYEIDWQLKYPIKVVLPLPDVDGRHLAAQVSNRFKRGLEEMKRLGTWMRDTGERFQSIVDRYVMGPMRQITSALEAFISGATFLVELPVRIMTDLLSGIDRALTYVAEHVERVGALVDSASTVGINFLRNIKRTAQRLLNAGAHLFKTDLQTARDGYASQVYEDEVAGDSDVVLADKATSPERAYASRLAGGTYQSALSVKVRAGDTLQALALKHLSDASRWRDIAMLNGFEGNDDLVTGNSILIPVNAGPEGSGIANDLSSDRYYRDNSLEQERLYGRDIQTVQGPDGRLDIVFGEDNDIATVGGYDNLIQAVQLKTRIRQGTLLENPEYGLRRLVGERGHPLELPALKHGLQVAVESDPRIAEARVIAEQEGNVVNVSYELIPVGVVGRRPVSAVVGRI